MTRLTAMRLIGPVFAPTAAAEHPRAGLDQPMTMERPSLIVLARDPDAWTVGTSLISASAKRP